MAIERTTGKDSESSTAISEEVRRIRSEAMTRRWQDPVLRASRVQSISQAIKDKWKEEEYRKKSSRASSRNMRRKWQDPEYRARLSEVHKLRWQDPEYRASRSTKTINQINKELWEEAISQNLIPKIIEEGFLSEVDVGVLERGFSRKRPKRAIPEDLMDKFSIAVARVA